MSTLKHYEIEALRACVRYIEVGQYAKAQQSFMLVNWAALPDICGERPFKIYSIIGKQT